MNPESMSLKKVQALADAELSLPARMGYVTLLLASAAMTAVVISLWVTEPSLPRRTQVAFGVMSLIGLSWCALAAWALRARRPLFARDRVMAGGMAVGFTGLFALAALAAVVMVGSPATYAALGTGVAMLALAVAALVQARRRFAALAGRRLQLERAQVK